MKIVSPPIILVSIVQHKSENDDYQDGHPFRKTETDTFCSLSLSGWMPYESAVKSELSAASLTRPAVGHVSAAVLNIVQFCSLIGHFQDVHAEMRCSGALFNSNYELHHKFPQLLNGSQKPAKLNQTPSNIVTLYFKVISLLKSTPLS